MDRKLWAVTSLLSPEPHDRRTPRHAHLSAADDDVIIVASNDDDVIAVTPHPGVQGSPYSSSVREIPLKVRCRTDVHKIPVLSVRRLKRHGDDDVTSCHLTRDWFISSRLL